MSDKKKFVELGLKTPPLSESSASSISRMYYQILSKDDRQKHDDAWKKRIAEKKHSSAILPMATAPASLLETVDQIKHDHYQEQIFSFMKPKAMETSFMVLAKENLADFSQGAFNFSPVKLQKNELK